MAYKCEISEECLLYQKGVCEVIGPCNFYEDMRALAQATARYQGGNGALGTTDLIEMFRELRYMKTETTEAHSETVTRTSRSRFGPYSLPLDDRKPFDPREAIETPTEPIEAVPTEPN